MNSPLKKIISGGQNGVDQAALRAARRCNLLTGGTMPKDFKTLDGPQPRLAQEFGLTQCTGGYAERTWINVGCSSATLVIAKNLNSRGEKCTRNAIKCFKKSTHVVQPDWNGIDHRQQIALRAVSWMISLKGDLKVLNVAGNSEHTSPGIGVIAEEFLVEILLLYVTACRAKENW